MSEPFTRRPDRTLRPNVTRRSRAARARAIRNLESLESRTLLTSTLYLDYGDLFPSGVLSGITVGEILSHTAPGGVNINGPELSDNTGSSFDPATSVQLTSFNTIYGATAATVRAEVHGLVQRIFAPFDIDVVELTAATTIIEGNPVRAASSLDDISQNLAANNSATKHNDSYLLISQLLIGGTTDDETTNPTRFPDYSYVGIANDLNMVAAGNVNENSALALLNEANFSSQTLADIISHEAGHLLGLFHAYRQDQYDPPPPSLGSRGPDLDLYHGTEQMSYLMKTGYNVFSRMPAMRGDGNLNPDLLNTTPTSYDHLASDPEIGAAPVTYVTGSGAHDMITIQKVDATTATVIVEPFSDVDFNHPIILPGIESTSFSYQIDLRSPILIDGAGGDDFIVLDGNLGTSIHLQGGIGVDSLQIGAGGAAVQYTPGTNTNRMLNGDDDLRGTIVIDTTTIQFQELDAGGSVIFFNAGAVTFNGTGGNDRYTLSRPPSYDAQITGTAAGAAIIPVRFVGPRSLRFNTNGGTDELVIDANSANLVSVPISFDGGDGGDTLTMRGTPTATVDEVIYRPGPSADGGQITYEDSLNNVLMSVNFSGLEPVFALIPSSTLTVDGTGAANSITYTQSDIDPTWGQVTVDGFETIHFANKANLVINGLGGADAISLGNPTVPTGLVAIQVNGGLPTDGDHLNYVSQPTNGVALYLETGTITELAAPTVTYSGIESISLSGSGTAGGSGSILAIVGTTGNETFTLTSAAAGNGTATSDLAAPAVTFSDFLGGLSFDGGGGFDSLTVIGNDAANTATLAVSTLSFDAHVFVLADIDHLDLQLLGGDDTATLDLATVGLSSVCVDAGDGNDIVQTLLSPIPVTLLGGYGDDFLAGGSANDLLDGGEGDDLITGNLGDDTLLGHDGNDTLAGGGGDDVVFGGEGADAILWEAGDGNDTINGDEGDDTLIVSGDPTTGNTFNVLPNGTHVAVQGTTPAAFALDVTTTENIGLVGSTSTDNFEIGDLSKTAVREVDLSLGADAVRDVVKIHGTMLADEIGVTVLSPGNVYVDQSRNVGVAVHDIAGRFPAPDLNGDLLWLMADAGDDIIHAEIGVEEEAWLISNGGAGNDFIRANGDLYGGEGDDTLQAAGGLLAVEIQGAEGNDSIVGGVGDDILHGGTGDDTIHGHEGNDQIFGAEDNDSITGGDGDDEISGGVGNDTINAGEGDDSVWGSTGNDVIHGDFGNDTIEGDDGNDSINGGGGDDLITGGEGDDSLFGDDDNDTINGNDGNDLITGGNGDDFINGGDGNDWIKGNAGNDTVFGHVGNDTLLGDAGNDELDAGDGNDLLAGGTGNDTLYGQAGDDTLYGQSGNDSLLGGTGNDKQYGERGNDVVCGDEGNDTLCGGEGDDAVNGGAGDDRLIGRGGNDQIWGDDGNDTMLGGDGNDSMVGGGGDDSMDAGSGNDILWGDVGNDTLWGGNGDDLMYGGDNDDVMLGGTPATANVAHRPRNPRLPSDGNDTMHGGLGFDQVDGGNGNNMLDAGNEGIRETLLGGDGNDFGYIHKGTSPRGREDVAALDGGFNHIFLVGGLIEIGRPYEQCGFTTFAGHPEAYYGWLVQPDGQMVKHPSTRPSNVVVRVSRNVVVSSPPARPAQAAAKPSPFTARAALLKSLRNR